MQQEFGIIGGTGNQGSALAKRLARLDYTVRIGSRSERRGRAKAQSLNNELGSANITGGNNEYATNAEIIVLAIPFDQIDVLLDPLKENFVDKIVIDMTVNLKFGKYVTAKLYENKSSYEYIREKFDRSLVVACLKTISFVKLESEDELDQTDFQMSLSDEAYQFTSELVRKFGLEPVRVRGKTHAHTIERMVALSIQLNKEYKGSHTGYKVTDLTT